MAGPATIQDMIVFIAASTVIGGLLLLLAGLVADAAKWGMTAKDEGGTDEPAVPATISHRRRDGSAVCICSDAMHDDGRGEWDSVTFTRVVNEACPICGPEGREWHWIDVTTTSDAGRTRCIRGDRKREPHAPGA